MVIGLTAFGVRSQTTSFSDPVDYNDYIIDLQDGIGYSLDYYMLELNDSAATYDDCEFAREVLVMVIEDAVDSLKRLAPYDGNTDFRDRAVELFNFYYSIVQNEYKQIQDILFLTDYTTEDEMRYNSLVDDIVARETVYDDNFAAAQQAFADKYGFELVDDYYYDDSDTSDYDEW